MLTVFYIERSLSRFLAAKCGDLP